jgi:hypothetical protein
MWNEKIRQDRETEEPKQHESIFEEAVPKDKRKSSTKKVKQKLTESMNFFVERRNKLIIDELQVNLEE